MDCIPTSDVSVTLRYVGVWLLLLKICYGWFFRVYSLVQLHLILNLHLRAILHSQLWEAAQRLTKASKLEQRVRSLQWFNRNFSCSHPVPRLTRSLSSPRAGVVNECDSDKYGSLGMRRCSNTSHRMEFLEYILKNIYISFMHYYRKVLSSN